RRRADRGRGRGQRLSRHSRMDRLSLGAGGLPPAIGETLEPAALPARPTSFSTCVAEPSGDLSGARPPVRRKSHTGAPADAGAVLWKQRPFPSDGGGRAAVGLAAGAAGRTHFHTPLDNARLAGQPRPIHRSLGT